MISDLRKGVSVPSAPTAFLPPSVSVVNDSNVVINSLNPVTILAGQIELTAPSKVLISGVINGTCVYVVGVAIYVNGVPMNARPNRCHPDCMQVVFGNGASNRMLPVPFELVTDVLGAGVHEVRVAILSRWSNEGAFVTHVNNRSSGNMASASTLTLRAI